MGQETTLNDIMDAIVGLNQKMDTKFERIDKRFDEVNFRLDEHDKRFDLLEVKLDQVGANRILVLEREVEVLKNKLGHMIEDVESLKKAK